MKVQYKENGDFTPCPEYNGIAKIVDTTDLTEYTSQYGTKEKFRFILEINQEKSKGVYYTVTTMPMAPSYHEKSNLRKFTESVLGRKMNKEELLANGGYDTEELIGKYCQIIVEHVQTEDGNKTYANIKYVGKTKDAATWKSDYIRLADRLNRKLKSVPTQEDAIAEEAEESLVN